MDFDTYDSRTLQRCQGFMTKFFGDELVRTRSFTNHHRLLNTSELKWTSGSMDTYVWCREYIRQHSGGGSNSRNTVKRQSKRKNLRLRRVSKKY